MEKRGQVTVFIILGIVILTAIGGLLAFRSGLIDTYLSSERDRVKIPSELSPVQEYIEFCLEDSVKQGVSYMSLQGGYLKLDTYKPSSADKFTNVLTAYSGYKVAYWYYEDLNGEGRNQMPSLELMQAQLNEFVKRSFSTCLSDLKDFENEGFEIETKDFINPDIKIEKDFIDAVVRSPVNVKKESVSVKIPRHVVIVDSSFGRLYDKAKQIFEKENTDLWLEGRTVNYLDVYTEDLPHYDVKFTCKSLLWKKNEIAEDYKKILELNMPYYMVKGSVFENYYLGEPSLTWDLENDFSDVNVAFSYDRNWPFELDIQGTDGDAVVSQPFPGGIPIIKFCVNNYNFIYSIKYPVLISVRDPDTDEEFSFANQVVVRNNQARKQIEGVEKISYCGAKTIDVNVNVASPDENGFHNSVSEASVFYNCMNNKCYLGDTNEEGIFSGKAPACLGGNLEIINDGYKFTNVDYDTFGGSGDISISLEKLVSVNYEFMVYDLSGETLIGPRALSDKEKIVFEINDLTDNSYSSIGFYPDENQSVEFSPGNYRLVAKLLNKGPAHIQAKQITQCGCPEVPLAGCLCGEQSVTLDAFDIDDVVTGGAELTFSVDRGDLNSNKVIFYVINKGMPNNYDDLTLTYNSADISLGYENNLIPRFENE